MDLFISSISSFWGDHGVCVGWMTFDLEAQHKLIKNFAAYLGSRFLTTLRGICNIIHSNQCEQNSRARGWPINIDF